MEVVLDELDEGVMKELGGGVWSIWVSGGGVGSLGDERWVCRGGSSLV